MTERRIGLAVAAMVAAPAIVGIAYSAAAAVGLAGPSGGGFDPNRAARVLGEAAVWESVVWTVAVSAAATALATAGAVVLALAFRSARPSARLGRALAVAPLPIPVLVAALVGVLVLGQSGMLARLALMAGWIESPGELPPLVYDQLGLGLIVTTAWKELPFLALLAFTVLATEGVALEETARTLGAGPWATFRRVTWPTLWRGLLPGAAAVFAFVAGSYEAAALLAPSDPLPLPVLIEERHTDPDLARRADAYVLALLGMAIGAAAVTAHEWARGRGERSRA